MIIYEKRLDMFKKILGSKKVKSDESVDNALIEKISKMTLSDMKLYIQDKVKDFAICEEGVDAVMRKLTTQDSEGLYYLKLDDMDVKKKKAFDLILLIAKSKKMTMASVELIQTFVEVHQDIIISYDKEFKEIYASRFKDAISVAVATISTLTELQTKMQTLSN